MVAAAVAILLLILIMWILFIPVVVVLDTDTARLDIQQRGTFSWHLTFSGRPAVRIFGINIRLKEAPRKNSSRRTSRKGSSITKSFNSWLFLIRRILQAFRIRKFVAQVDTGDVTLNAQLVPVAILINNDRLSFTTNFIGRNYLRAEVEVRLNRVLWSFILFLTKK
jgi:hypothetical protein